MTGPGFPSAIAALAVVTSLACQPHYRDDLVRGRASERAVGLFSQADQASGAGNHRRCADLARRAIAANPQTYSGNYHLLARCQLAAGQHARARATARRGLELHPGDTSLQGFLVAAYRADDLIANALDFVDPPSIEGAVAAGITELADLVTALHQASTDPAAALALYSDWLAAYGVPDHRLIRSARDRLLAITHRDPTTAARLAELRARARAEANADHLDVAILYYSQAYRLLPESVVVEDDQGFATAGARVTDPAAIDPFACNHAKEGNDALRKQQLGPAIRHYRRAVAAAPWWAAARKNLGLLLRIAGQYDESQRQLEWAARLAPGASAGTMR